MASRTYKITPFGIATGYPWLSKADTKFNSSGIYHTKLTLSGPEAIKLQQEIEAAAQEAFDAFFETDEGKKISPKDRKSWSVYVPFEAEEDDAGNPTGYVTFDFKQNATIKLRDGTEKKVVIGIKDAKNKPVVRPVFGGSEIRIMYSERPIPMKSLKKVGVRLDFAQVQVRKLAESAGGGGKDFEEIEDGYVEEQSGDFQPDTTSDNSGGDY